MYTTSLNSYYAEILCRKYRTSAGRHLDVPGADVTGVEKFYT